MDLNASTLVEKWLACYGDLPLRDLLVGIFDCHGVRSILRWSVVDRVGTVAIVFDPHGLHGTFKWKKQNKKVLLDEPDIIMKPKNHNKRRIGYPSAQKV